MIRSAHLGNNRGRHHAGIHRTHRSTNTDPSPAGSSGSCSGWKNRLATILLVTLSISVVTSVSSAAEYTAAHKFRRGVSNLTLGVLAIPGQMTTKTREKGWAVGLPLGFAQGLGWFVTTEAVGVWELLTCPFEFPPKFRPIIDPEYPWEYFEKRNTGAGLP